MPISSHARRNAKQDTLWCVPWGSSYAHMGDLGMRADLKIPKYDPSAHIKQVETEFEPLLKSASELEAFSTKREAEIRAEIKTIDDEIVRCPCLICMPATCHREVAHACTCNTCWGWP